MGKGLTAMIAISEWISERSPVDAVGLISIQSVLLVTIALVIATMATTWLRLAAVPFALAGLLTVSDTRTPDVLISEDAHLVAMPIGGGELAINRVRSNEFTTDNWKRAAEVRNHCRTRDFREGRRAVRHGSGRPAAGLALLLQRRSVPRTASVRRHRRAMQKTARTLGERVLSRP